MSSNTEQLSGNLIIKNALKKYLDDWKPIVVGKLGNSEYIGSMYFLNNMPMSPQHRYFMTTIAGVYPDTDETLNKYFELFLGSIGCIDIAAEWLNGDKTLLKSKNPNVELVPLRSLEPYYHDDPWSSELEGHAVTIVSPFSKSIESQYKKRNEIWGDKNILPEFGLKNVKSPYLSMGQGEGDWFDALDEMYDKVLETTPTVVIVGAGAFSIPLLAKLKKEGITGIHMGGATQILFGIKGKRWDNHDVISTFYNEHWVRPSEEEIPDNKERVEGGCYW
jgi:hypothetical protein